MKNTNDSFFTPKRMVFMAGAKPPATPDKEPPMKGPDTVMKEIFKNLKKRPAKPSEKSVANKSGDAEIGNVEVKDEKVPLVAQGITTDDSGLEVNKRTLFKAAAHTIRGLNSKQKGAAKVRKILHEGDTYTAVMPYNGRNYEFLAGKNPETGKVDLAFQSFKS